MRILYTLLLVFYKGITIAQPPADKKYFEGTIEYDIISVSYLQGVPDNEIRERMGSTLKFHFREGDYIREYIDGAGYTLRKFIYKKDKNMFYMLDLMNSPDTLYFSSAATSSYINFKVTPGPKEKILNFECPSSVISAQYVAPFLPDTAAVTFTYFFCPELPVNPEWHKDIYLWKDVIKVQKSVAIKIIEDDPQFIKQTFTASKIIWQPLDKSVFSIDPKLVLKEMQDF